MNAAIPDIIALKARLQAMWSAGDFGRIARSHESGAQAFIARLHLAPGSRVLDVACGTGNLAIPAARAGTIVTGVDIASNLVEQARQRAKAEGLVVEFHEGDAENLPYEDGSFDTVMTMFGAMFAPQPEKAAAELKRVCRPKGHIVMANWVPTGFIGQMFKIIAARVPPPAGMPSPLLWGDETVVRERLQKKIAHIQFTRRMMTFEFPFAPAEVVEHWRQYYGPTQKAFDALDTDGQRDLRTNLTALWEKHNRGDGAATRVESEYLEVVATRA